MQYHSTDSVKLCRYAAAMIRAAARRRLLPTFPRDHPSEGTRLTYRSCRRAGVPDLRPRSGIA
jgi:hypothetical protein